MRTNFDNCEINLYNSVQIIHNVDSVNRKILFQNSYIIDIDSLDLENRGNKLGICSRCGAHCFCI